MPSPLRPEHVAGVGLGELAALVGSPAPPEPQGLYGGPGFPSAPRPLASLASTPPSIAEPPDLGVRITGVTLRAQEARPHDLFAALPGSSAHGADFAADALARGATAILTDPVGADRLRGTAAGVPLLTVPNPRAVLGALAARVYDNPSRRLQVVGITGTSGKTTTSYLAEAGLRAAGRVVGLIGTVGVRIDGVDVPSALTTPEAPALQALLAVMAERGVDTVVMEVSSHALELGRVDGVEFAVGAFTNLSRDHLDFHPTMADYFEAKARLFDPAAADHARTAVICVDDEAGAAMAARAADPVTVAVDAAADQIDRRRSFARSFTSSAVAPFGRFLADVPFGAPSFPVLANATADSNAVDVLVEAFSTEVPKRGQVEIDRTFMALVIGNPEYRLRWLDWGQDLVAPITDFLALHFTLGTDSFTRELPAQLIIQTCRHAYVYWVEHGDFAGLRSALRMGMTMIVGALPLR